MNLKSGLKSSSIYVLVGIGTLLVVVCISFLIVFSRNFTSDLYCESVMRVATLEKTVYATTIDRESNHRNYQSNDGGMSWDKIDEVPTLVEDALNLANYRELDSVCHPNNEDVCYQLGWMTREESAPEFPSKLEKTVDGGKTWQEVTLPTAFKSKPGCQDYHPRSLALVEMEAEQGGYNLVVAIAQGGVLVLPSNGEWLQRELDIMAGVN